MKKTADLRTWPIVHVYAQFEEHDSLLIVGTRTGIDALRAALEQAWKASCLEDAGYAEAQLTVNDGEGYECYVIAYDDAAVIERAVQPYAGYDFDRMQANSATPLLHEHELLRMARREATR